MLSRTHVHSTDTQRTAHIPMPVIIIIIPGQNVQLDFGIKQKKKKKRKKMKRRREEKGGEEKRRANELKCDAETWTLISSNHCAVVAATAVVFVAHTFAFYLLTTTIHVHLNFILWSCNTVRFRSWLRARALFSRCNAYSIQTHLQLPTSNFELWHIQFFFFFDNFFFLRVLVVHLRLCRHPSTFCRRDAPHHHTLFHHECNKDDVVSFFRRFSLCLFCCWCYWQNRIEDFRRLRSNRTK